MLPPIEGRFDHDPSMKTTRRNRSRRLNISPSRRILKGKTQHFAARLSPEISPNTAPAMKSHPPTAANKISKNANSAKLPQNWQLRISATLTLRYSILSDSYSQPSEVFRLMWHNHVVCHWWFQGVDSNAQGQNDHRNKEHAPKGNTIVKYLLHEFHIRSCERHARPVSDLLQTCSQGASRTLRKAC